MTHQGLNITIKIPTTVITTNANMYHTQISHNISYTGVSIKDARLLNIQVEIPRYFIFPIITE